MSVSKINFNDKNEAFIVVDPISEIDKDDFKKYLDIESSHFLNCEFENDKVFTLFYSYDGLIPLKNYLSQVLEKENVLTFLKSLTHAFIEAEEKGLYTGHILLGIQSVFCHPQSHRVSCVYVPVVDGAMQERPLRLFLKEIIVNMMYSEEEDVTWLGEVVRYISNHRQLNYSDFYNFLDELEKKPVGIQQMKASVWNENTQVNSNKNIEVKSLSDTDEIAGLNSVLEPVAEKNPVLNKTNTDALAYLYRRMDHSTYILGAKDMHIGKAASNEICIKDNPVISRVHAIIRYVDGAFVIQDNGSTNHTFVNGFVLNPDCVKVLSANDRILLGNEEFIFKV